MLQNGTMGIIFFFCDQSEINFGHRKDDEKLSDILLWGGGCTVGGPIFWSILGLVAPLNFQPR